MRGIHPAPFAALEQRVGRGHDAVLEDPDLVLVALDLDDGHPRRVRLRIEVAASRDRDEIASALDILLVGF